MIVLYPHTVVVVGLEQTEYTGNEDDGSVEVCVGVLEPDEIDSNLFIFGQLSTATGTAGKESTSINTQHIIALHSICVNYTLYTISPCSDETDFTGINEIVFISSTTNRLRQCFNISISGDNETESTEQFLVQFTESDFLPPNVIFEQTNATVTVRDGGK